MLVDVLTTEFKRGTSPANITKVLQSFQFSLRQWNDYISFNDYRYSRNLIAFDENFSLMLLCWNKEQATPIHTHGAGQICWMKVIDGELELTTYADESGSHPLGPPLRLTTSDNIMLCPAGEALHRTRNPSSHATAVSLHIYSPPYLECCFTERGRRDFVPVVYKPLPVSHAAGDCRVSTKPLTSSDQLRLRCVARHGGRRPSGDVTFTSLERLVTLLRSELSNEMAADRSPEQIARVTRVLESLRFHPQEFSQYAHFENGHYTRNLVGYDEKFTLLLLCWEVGQASPIHSHAGSSCWMKILQGEMKETRYAEVQDGIVRPFRETVMPEETVAYIDDSLGVHKMENPTRDRPAISLHVYSPPYTRCFCFDPQAGGKKEVTIGKAYNVTNPFVEQSFAQFAMPNSEVPNVATLVERLHSEIDGRNWELATQLLANVKFDPKEWAKYIHFSEHRYTRILIAFNEHFSLMLLCWNGGQATPLHDHGSEQRRVWMRVLRGELEYVEYESMANPVVTSRTRYSPANGVVCYCDSNCTHVVRNTSSTDTAISLHLYNPPYIECTFPDGAVPVVYCKANVDMTGKEGLLEHPTALHASISCRRQIFSSFHAFVDLLRYEFAASGGFQCSNTTLKDKLTALMTSHQFHPQEWEKYAAFDERHYTRILVAEDVYFSLVLTCWAPKQRSPPHDHDGSAAWVKPLDGELLDTVYDTVASLNGAGRRLGEVVGQYPFVASKKCCSKAVCPESAIRFVPVGVVHSITNTSETKPAVSLHLYAPPLRRCNCFSLVTRESKPMDFQEIFQECCQEKLCRT